MRTWGPGATITDCSQQSGWRLSPQLLTTHHTRSDLWYHCFKSFVTKDETFWTSVGFCSSSTSFLWPKTNMPLIFLTPCNGIQWEIVPQLATSIKPELFIFPAEHHERCNHLSTRRRAFISTWHYANGADVTSWFSLLSLNGWWWGYIVFFYDHALRLFVTFVHAETKRAWFLITLYILTCSTVRLFAFIAHSSQPNDKHTWLKFHCICIIFVID